MNEVFSLTSFTVGLFIDLDTECISVKPNIRALAEKVLEGVGEEIVTQFRICRDMMFRAGEGEDGRHEPQHPRPRVEHAKAFIATAAIACPAWTLTGCML
jgi:hypothetical protein